MDPIEILPSEILVTILLNLEVRDILNLRTMSSRWRQIVKDEMIWKHLVLRDFSVTTEILHSWVPTYVYLFHFTNSPDRIEIAELFLRDISDGNFKLNDYISQSFGQMMLTLLGDQSEGLSRMPGILESPYSQASMLYATKFFTVPLYIAIMEMYRNAVFKTVSIESEYDENRPREPDVLIHVISKYDLKSKEIRPLESKSDIRVLKLGNESRFRDSTFLEYIIYKRLIEKN